MNATEANDFVRPDWESIIEAIKADDPAGGERLNRALYRGLWYLAFRQCPEHADDVAQEAVIQLMVAIRRGQVKHPAALPGYARTILHRLIAGQIAANVKTRSSQVDIDTLASGLSEAAPNPEQQAQLLELAGIVRQVLASMRSLERELLCRFYLDSQNPTQICTELHLTQTQFRLAKSRAKAKFAALARHRLGMRKPSGTAHASMAAQMAAS